MKDQVSKVNSTISNITEMLAFKKENLENFKNSRCRLEKDYKRTTQDVLRLEGVYQAALKRVTKTRNALDSAQKRFKKRCMMLTFYGLRIE